jgi:hypothetical protein
LGEEGEEEVASRSCSSVVTCFFACRGGERRGEFSPPSRVPGFLSFLWVILRPMCNDPVFSSSSCDDVAFSNPFRFFECNKPPTLYLPVMQPPPPPPPIHTHKGG